MPCTVWGENETPKYSESEKANDQARRDNEALYYSAATVLLCETCEEMEKYDMLRYRSPALQEFWRTHTEHDKRRLQEQMQHIKLAEEKVAALAKLTDREKKLIGL